MALNEQQHLYFQVWESKRLTTHLVRVLAGVPSAACGAAIARESHGWIRLADQALITCRKCQNTQPYRLLYVFGADLAEAAKE